VQPEFWYQNVELTTRQVLDFDTPIYGYNRVRPYLWAALCSASALTAEQASKKLSAYAFLLKCTLLCHISLERRHLASPRMKLVLESQCKAEELPVLHVIHNAKAFLNQMQSEKQRQKAALTDTAGWVGPCKLTPHLILEAGRRSTRVSQAN
jgi:hypothetical protein